MNDAEAARLTRLAVGVNGYRTEHTVKSERLDIAARSDDARHHGNPERTRLTIVAKSQRFRFVSVTQTCMVIRRAVTAWKKANHPGTQSALPDCTKP
ncbi:hypothetical protein [Paraburkholderia sp. J12]|uniref:hypothetical protein n=1 Tax=Paraburkholderia sp. J12 TaxID=2805432 RepID=UPI002ABE347B|nr:hypothetical protein [Paraburkholderia sp. J12]